MRIDLVELCRLNERQHEGGAIAAAIGAREQPGLPAKGNSAQRALGRRNWTFCGSDRGGERAAAIYSLIAKAKLNDIDPETWLADVLRRINDHPASKLDELLPWHWRPQALDTAAA